MNEEIAQAGDNRNDWEYYCGYSDDLTMLLNVAKGLASMIEMIELLNIKEMEDN